MAYIEEKCIAGSVVTIRKYYTFKHNCKGEKREKRSHLTSEARCQKLMSFGVLDISPEQKNLIHEAGLYEYDKKSIEAGKEVPVKQNDHCMDAMRYVVMGMWKYLKYFLPAAEQED